MNRREALKRVLGLGATAIAPRPERMYEVFDPVEEPVGPEHFAGYIDADSPTNGVVTVSNATTTTTGTVTTYGQASVNALEVHESFTYTDTR